MNDSIVSDVQFYRFRSSYRKLAANAYNQSLGAWQNNQSRDITTNQEMKNLPENSFVQELSDAKLSYDELTVDKAKEIMNETLSMVGDQTGMDSTVLKKVVELALYNESLYGLFNFAGNMVHVINDYPVYRSHHNFETKIYDAKTQTNTQSIDDRTM